MKFLKRQKELKKKIKDDTVKYEFQASSIDDFDLNLNLTLENAVFEYIFEQIFPKITKRLKITKQQFNTTKDVIQKIKIKEFFGEQEAKRYLPIISRAIGNALNKIIKEIENDLDIIIIRTWIDEAEFINKRDWEITVYVKGVYSK